jgi:DMSO reductase anchor subunit
VNPAPSIVFFTTASGAGYGILFWLGLLWPLGLVPREAAFGLVALGTGLFLVTAGLLSSLLHLGRPERALRAFSQWRSSWLSREGVAAAATYIPAVLLGLAMPAGPSVLAALLGLLTAAGAAATVFCTGMIYASLKPVRQWRHPLVVPGYLLLASFSGAAAVAMTAAWWGRAEVPAGIALVSGAAAFALKLAYWRDIAKAPPAGAPTIETATGLGAIGRTRPLDPPHTETNYLLREMGYRIARKHAASLRLFAQAVGFGVPLLLLALALATGGGPTATLVLLTLAAKLAFLGLLVERWLMFAEATHTVTLYYTGR